MDRPHTGWAGVRTRWCLWTTVYAARQSPACCSSTANGIEGLARFGYAGGACRLSPEQQERLKTWIAKTLPRTTREVGAWIAQECGAGYESRSGLVALLHRRGMEHRKPKAISRKLAPEKQAAFVKKYEDLLNQLSADEAAIFGDAVHPTHAVRPVGCWAPKNIPVAITRRWSRPGWRGRAAGSGCISCPTIALIRTRSSGCGGSYTGTSPTTSATPPSETSAPRC